MREYALFKLKMEITSFVFFQMIEQMQHLKGLAYSALCTEHTHMHTHTHTHTHTHMSSFYDD